MVPLRELQDQLLVLKERYGKALHLKKAASDAPGAPFPVLLRIDVDPPLTAESYDVGALQLELRLEVTILSDHSDEAGGPMGLCACIHNPEIPLELRAAIGERLEAAWASRRREALNEAFPGSSASLCLEAPITDLRRNFVSHITCKHHLLEAYQSEDAAGRTLRRFAIVEAASEREEQEAALQEPPKPSLASAAPGGKSAVEPSKERGGAGGSGKAGGRKGDSQPALSAGAAVFQPGSSRSHASHALPASPQPHKHPEPLSTPMQHSLLSSELQYLRRRFGALFSASPSSSSSSSANAAAPSAASTHAAPPKQDEEQRWSLQLQATDPDWDRGTITLLLACRLCGTAAAPEPCSTTPASIPTPAEAQIPASTPFPDPAPASASAAPAPSDGNGPFSATIRWPSRPPVARPARAIPACAPASGPLCSVSLSVHPDCPMPIWLRAFLDSELALLVGPAASKPSSEFPPMNGGVRVEGGGGAEGGSGAGSGGVGGGAAADFGVAPPSVKRAVLQLENYGGAMLRRAEEKAVSEGHRVRIDRGPGGAGAREERVSQSSRGRNEEEEEGGSVSDGSEDEEEEGSEEDEHFSDDGYGDDGMRHGRPALHGAHGRGDIGKGGGRPRGRTGAGSGGEEGGRSEEASHDEAGRMRISEEEEVEEEEIGLDGDQVVDEASFHGAGNGAGGDAEGSGAGAWHCTLEGLQLDEVEVAEMIRAPFQVACGRCGHAGSVELTSEAVAPLGGGGSGKAAGRAGSKAFEVEAECPGCHAPWAAAAQPRFVHAGANVLCALKLRGCVPRDLLPCMLAVQCGRCSGVMTMRSVQVGMPQERCCSSCHLRMSLSIAAVSFVPRGPPAGARTGQAASSAGGPSSRQAGKGRQGGQAREATAALQVGTPLPAFGACSHYRHSYRWLRFPCCGARFPCDLCHEQNSDHDLKWASRMVCGFCSLEQRVSNICVACNRKLACSAAAPMGKVSRFWDGGTGCRSTVSMTKKDPHKFRGKRKTTSNKSNRVGPKAWSKEMKNKEKTAAQSAA